MLSVGATGLRVDRDDRHLGDSELGMLHAIMKTTAYEAARFGFASSSFHRCSVNAWRVDQAAADAARRGVSVEMVVTRCRQLLSHETGTVLVAASDA